MSSTTYYALIMLAAGIGVPMLAALNAALGVRLGSPAAAAVFLFMIAFGCAVLVLLLFDKPVALVGALSAPKHLFLGGILVAFYVLSITYIAPHFGVGNAVFAVLLGQLISAAIIDHFGLFGAPVTPLTLTRAMGIALMAAGVFITQQVK
ncbi:DMT family transporter [Roseovarius sp. EL26]|uniref:DMT family transporter n=1 Tax=Roseovarius sp. EL26 TaxID=2126672 RepID=UPI000EA209FA|nr:DMT family transporter [Roseovarius sp. EL26]